MKIAIAVGSIVRSEGQGRVNVEMVRALMAAGWDVTLIAHRVAPELIESGVGVIPAEPFMSRPQLIRALSAANRTDRLLQKHAGEFDLVVGNGFSTRFQHDVNVCHFVHGSWMTSPGNPSRKQRTVQSLYQRTYTYLNSKWEKTSYAAAKHVVAVSENVRRDLVGIGLPDEKISVIYNGVDLQEFRPGEGNRKAYELPNGVPLALFAGDIKTPRKNLDTVLRALVKVPQLHLAVVGDTERSIYPAMATNLGVGNRTHFLGFRRDINQIMRCSDFFVFPSRYDPCPLVALEAIASGLPIITSRATGAADIATADTGYVLGHPDDVDGCAAHMQQLATDRELRTRLSQGARVEAERHSWAEMCRQYIQLFETYVHENSQIRRRVVH